MFKLYIFSILISLPFFILSNNNEDKFLNNEIKIIRYKYKEQIYFKKTCFFFKEKNWDSILVYSSKQLSNYSNKELTEYCHFFRGISFFNKNLLNEAKKEFNIISPKFKLKYSVNLNLGEIALEEKKYYKALEYYKDAERLINDKRYFYKKSSIMHNLGICYNFTFNYEKANYYLLKSLRLQELEKDTLLIIGTNMDLAILYFDSDKNKAYSFFKKAYILSKSISDFAIKKTAVLNMSIIEELNSNFPLALNYRKEFEQWSDSLNNQNKIWDIAQSEKKFAVQQKQKEINVLALENRAKNAERNGLLASSVLLTGLILTGGYFYRQKIKNGKIILLQKNELDQLNEAKDKLFSIVSHDLRSSVNALKNSNQKLLKNLETKNYTDIDQLLQRNSNITNSSYNLLDNLLNWAQQQNNQLYFQKEFLQLHSIINQVEYNFKYLFLEKNIIFYNKVEKENLVFMDLDSLKIILRNFLDNALKYSPNGGAISMYCVSNEKNGYIQLVIEDTGLGMSQQRIHELLDDHKLLMKKDNKEIIGTGLGIQLCKTMLKKNGGDLFAIESEEGEGTKIILLLPKVKRDESN